MRQLWVDKYRPKTLDDYIWQDAQTRKLVESAVESGVTDNLLLTGPPGVGKTSLARVIVKELKVDPSDVLEIAASREGNVETIRDDVYSFVSSGGWAGMKYVLLDEADGMTGPAQFGLKDAMEANSHVARFILTGNVRTKIIPPLQDRCTKIDIHRPDREQFTERMVSVLTKEGIQFEDDEGLDALDTIIGLHYPSIRACLRDLQRFSVGGRLERPATLAASGTRMDWKLTMAELFKAGKIREARELICKSATKDELVEVYTWLYENSKVFADQEEAIVIIADGLHRHSFSADPEICLSATLVQLGRIGR